MDDLQDESDIDSSQKELYDLIKEELNLREQSTTNKIDSKETSSNETDECVESENSIVQKLNQTESQKVDINSNEREFEESNTNSQHIKEEEAEIKYDILEMHTIEPSASNELNESPIDKIEFEESKIISQNIQLDPLYNEDNKDLIDFLEEKNVEIIDMPEEENEEPILPDNDTIKTLAIKSEKDCETEITESTANAAEIPTKEQSDLVIYTSETADDTVTTTTAVEMPKTVKDSNVLNTVEDDSDEVQIIEPPNSPINIDSDTDDEQHKGQEENVAIARTYKQTARKSVSRSAITILSMEARNRLTETITLKSRHARRKKRVQILEVCTIIPKSAITSMHIQTNKKSKKKKKKRNKKENVNVNANSINEKSTTDNSEHAQNVKESNNSANQTNVNNISETASNANSDVVHNSSEANTSDVNGNDTNDSAETNKAPLMFVAKLDSRSVIIPNAFYASQQHCRSMSPMNELNATITLNANQLTFEQQIDFHMKRWLKNFFSHFINPRMTATAFSLVLLEKVLSPEIYNAIRNRRYVLNAIQLDLGKDVDETLQQQLHNIFYADKEQEQLTLAARRFCELGCTFACGQNIPLTAEINDGRTTSSTYQVIPYVLQVMRAAIEAMEKGQNNAAAGTTTTTTKTLTKSTSLVEKAKRKRATANKQKQQKEKHKKRKKRKNKSEMPAPPAKNYKRIATSDIGSNKQGDNATLRRLVQRLVEEHRKQALEKLDSKTITSDKSFESVFINTFYRNSLGSKEYPDVSKSISNESINKMKQNISNIHKTINNMSAATTTTPNATATSSTTIDATANFDTATCDLEELLTHTVVAANTIGDTITVKQIFKPTLKTNNNSDKQKKPEPTKLTKSQTQKEEEVQSEIITCDSNDSDDVQVVEQSAELHQQSQSAFPAPLNIDPNFCVDSPAAHSCVLCQQHATDIVSHYVNEHAYAEVYTSRLSIRQLTLLLSSEHAALARLHVFLNDQNQYEAGCIFCEKRKLLTKSHWYQHFTTHTGEYAYRCSGCQLRTATRTDMMKHISATCSRFGRLTHETTLPGDVAHIEALLCTLCHFVQLKSSIVLEHLIVQHNVQHNITDYIKMVTIIQFPQAANNADACVAVQPTTVIYSGSDNKAVEQKPNDAADVVEVKDDIDDDVMEVKTECNADVDMEAEEFQWINK